eukprot:m.82101 g.82101  ORF g.82101 m.82101 type:complete len:207 (+) comp12669_c0_seq1:290-910(+)
MMMSSKTLLVAISLVCLLGTAQASAPTTFTVSGKVLLPDDTSFTVTQVMLDGGMYVGFLKADGSFTIDGVLPASYTLEVANPHYQFQQLRLDVHGALNNNMRAFVADFLGATPQPYAISADGIRLVPGPKLEYFEQPAPWDIKSLLLNPSLLMLLLPMALVYLMPSKERMEEMQQQLKEEGTSAPNIGNMDVADTLSSFMAKSKSK